MKRVLINFIFVLSTITYLHSQSPFDLDTDAILNGDAEQNEEVVNQDKEVAREPLVKFDSFFTFENKFTQKVQRDVSLNPDDIFALETSENLINCLVGFDVIFPRNLNFFSRINGGIDISADSDSWSWDPYYGVQELYVTYSPEFFPIAKIEVGRKILETGNSYAFNIYNFYEYEKSYVKNQENWESLGTNALILALYGNHYDSRLLYVPGFEVADDYVEALQFKDYQRFGWEGSYYAKNLTYTGYAAYGTDSSWMTGLSLSASMGNNFILYSDLAYGTEYKTTLEGTGTLYGTMETYSLSEKRITAFKGSLLGVNASFLSFPDFIAEVYLNTAGYTGSDWESYNDKKDTIADYYENAGDPFNSYYYGVMGNLLGDYDSFEKSLLLLYLRLYDGSEGINKISWALNSFTNPLDCSVLLVPEFNLTINTHISLSAEESFFLGNLDSLWGQVPYWCYASLGFKISL